MPFTPRLTAPSRNDAYYYRNNIFYQSGYGMPNCTAYAWGRFYEISGERPKLCTGNAGDWYPYNKRVGPYTYGSTPQLGAVACWSRPGGAGHVAIVEQINSDGSVVMSESAYRSWNFKVRTHTPPNYRNMLGSAYVFQGFIYNPATLGLNSKLSAFIEEAESHRGEDNSWVCKVLGISKSTPWCAAFICAVAKTVGGILGTVIPYSLGASNIPRIGVQRGMGTWFDGPYYGRVVTPEPGDLISFRNERFTNPDKYTASHIGIVRDADSNKVYTVEGNTSSRVDYRTYDKSWRNILGYYRPNWSATGSSVNGLVYYEPLYTELNTREDSMMREVAYVNSAYQPSIYASNIKLSVINYTTMLNSIWEAYISSQPSFNANLDTLDSVPRTIVRYFMDKGMPTAAGIGIIANIYYESGFRTDAVEYGYTVSNGGIGLCQWTNYPRTAATGRNTSMRNFVGSDWRTDLTGQLDFLYKELTTSYTGTYKHLNNVTNNEAGARDAADYFVRHFERPANIETTARRRMDKASEYWKQIAVTLT